VEAFLRRPILRRLLPQEGPVSGLGLDSPLQDWDRLGQELRQRLLVIVRLEEALGVVPAGPAQP